MSGGGTYRQTGDDGTRDPEGIIHTLLAIGTTLIGVLTGHWLKKKKEASKLIGGMVRGDAGRRDLGRWFPINQNLWTSSGLKGARRRGVEE